MSQEEKTKADILDEVRRQNPNIHISINWALDDSFVWDGDGPDPAQDGLFPHDVTVTAMQIVNGELYEGRSSLGGSYSPLGGPHCPVIHGYLAQMVEEAIDELREEMAAFTHLRRIGE